MLFIRTFRLINSPVLRHNGTYRSSISLENLYPTSSLSLTTPVKIPENVQSFSGYIPVEKLDITYSRSSGPGGQNVQKVDTKVDIRFHVASADWLNDDLKSKIISKYKNFITNKGYLVVKSDKTRSQLYNQADAVTKLRELIRKSATPETSPPSEETIHLWRKRKERANNQRLSDKRAHSRKKESRREVY